MPNFLISRYRAVLWAVVLTSLVSAVASGVAGPAEVAAAAPSDPPNIVVVITDDQRWDTLWAMPNVESLLGDHGITFDSAFAVNPVCCPSRASFLTGNFSHTTGVYNNRSVGGKQGGFTAFDDSSTLATWLDATYDTGFFGKYLNGYGAKNPRYVPPGWDRWAGYLKGGYANIVYNVDGQIEDHTGEDIYGTDDLVNKADAFIRDPDRASDEPLFVYFAPTAPHSPWIPEPEDATLYEDLAPWRPPSHNEANIKDKPTHAGYENPTLKMRQVREIDNARLSQLRTLASVDRAVAQLVSALEDTGRLDNTLFLFTSDNGFMWGEHRLRGKANPYEEAIRLPFVMRYDPGIAAPGTVDDHIVANIDLAPTILELTGVTGDETEGDSLVPILEGTSTDWRDLLLIEHGAINKVDPSFCEARTERFMFTAHADDTFEFYDLALDPYELKNVFEANTYRQEIDDIRSRLRRLCRPLPPEFPKGIL